MSQKTRTRRELKQRNIKILVSKQGTATVQVYDGRMLMRPVHEPFSDEASAAEHAAKLITTYSALGWKYTITVNREQDTNDEQ